MNCMNCFFFFYTYLHDVIEECKDPSGRDGDEND